MMKVDLASVVHGLGKGLATADHLLAKAEDYAREQGVAEAQMLDWRLAPDMFSFRNQLQAVCNLANQWAARAAGVDVPPFVPVDDRMDAGQLRARIAEVRASVEALRPDQFEGRDDVSLTVDLGSISPTMPVGQWIVGFTVTNFYFHLSIAYGILRARGVQLSKPDLFAGGL
jgi:hypothetical protein